MEYPISVKNLAQNIRHVWRMPFNEECLKCSQEVLKFVETLNKIEIDLHKDDMKDIFFLNAKLVLNTVGLDNNLEELTEHQIYTYQTCLHYLQRVLEYQPFHEEARNLFKIIHIYLSKYKNIHQNIKNMTEVLQVHPCDYQIQFILGGFYTAIDDTTNANICLKLCCGIVDLELKTNPPQIQTKILKEFKVKSLYMMAVSYFNNFNYLGAEYYLLEALKVLQDDPDVHNSLGGVYKGLGLNEKAKKHFQIGIKNYKKAHISSPKTVLSALYTHIASSYLDEYSSQLAIKSYDKALEIEPTFIVAYQNKLLNTHYILHNIDDPMYLFNMHKDISKFLQITSNYKESVPNYKLNEEVLNFVSANKNRLTLTKKLNIGFISGEFSFNNIVAPVSFFINTILNYINFDIFCITCYSLKPVDSVLDMFPDVNWKYVNTMTAANIAEFKNIIVQDNIDILFDLISNTSNSQIKLFALKPSPIQIGYCGYPNTSGLCNMDYHITDKYCDSDGITQGPGGLVRPSTQKYYTEKLIFMDNCFLSYTPGVESFQVLQTEPVQRNGYLTIGTFNKLNKINEKMVGIWEQILQRCPNVKLALKIKEFNTEIIKERFFELWKDKSVIPQITLLPYSNTYVEHLSDYNLIDIALDTFPYSGTTTTCESLMMGTPVVTLFDSKRQYHVQNVSSSLLINSDLAEFVTFTEEEYIDKVCYYATHLDEVIGMKEQVRQKFSNGRVYDHVGFVDEFEDKLLQIYREHNW